MGRMHPDEEFIPVGRGLRVVQYNKECIVCGESFSAKKSNAKYCANKCAVAAYKKRHPERVKANRQKRRNTDEFRAKHNAYEKARLQRPEVKERTSKRRKELYANGGLQRQQELDDEKYGKKPMLTCSECGTQFQSHIRKKTDGSTLKKTCSKSCSHRRNNRLRLLKPKEIVCDRVRRSINHYLGKYRISKGGVTFALLGYSPMDLVKRIESQFTDGMSWDNKGEWHIDHIRPVVTFNFDSTDHPEFKECWALENLQPMWATDNLSKGSLWEGKRHRRKVIQ